MQFIESYWPEIIFITWLIISVPLAFIAGRFNDFNERP